MQTKTLFSLRCLWATLIVLLLSGTTACGDDPNDPAFRRGGTPTNRVRFTFDCDLQGLTGVLTMEVEAISDTGITWGPGPNPDITGVIATGDVLLITAGELQSPTARYVFNGQNQFADFTEIGTFERFRVQWVPVEGGLVMVINPFGPGPTQHLCRQTGAQFI